MKYTEITNGIENDEERRLSLAPEGFMGEPKSTIQLQVCQDGNDAYIDLEEDEVRILIDKLRYWLSVR